MTNYEYTFTDEGDAVWALVEELYQSAYDINETRIDAAMEFLAQQHGIFLDQLDNGLNIKHTREPKLSERDKLFNYMVGYSRAQAEFMNRSGRHAK